MFDLSIQQLTAVLLVALAVVAVGKLLFECRLNEPLPSRFDRRWPPISDEDYLRRCPSGTDRVVALKVRQIVSQQLGIPYDQIYPEQKLIDDLDCN